MAPGHIARGIDGHMYACGMAARGEACQKIRIQHAFPAGEGNAAAGRIVVRLVGQQKLHKLIFAVGVVCKEIGLWNVFYSQNEFLFEKVFLALSKFAIT